MPKSREDMDKFAHLASFEEIVEKMSYNMAIPRYIGIPLRKKNWNDRIVAKINQTNATIESQTLPFLLCLVSFMERPKKQLEELKAFVKAFRGGASFHLLFRIIEVEGPTL